MNGLTRFACPSYPISLRAVLARTSRALWYSAVLALALHGGISQWRMSPKHQQAAKPLTTRFVKRQPRLTKPLELKKRAQPRRRQHRREMVSVKARASRKHVASGIVGAQVLGKLARPWVQVSRQAWSRAQPLGPQAVAQVIEVTKEPKGQAHMSLELLDVEALDTGQYHAMVVQDPEDRRSIRGFCHLAIVPPITTERAATWEPAYSFDSYSFPALPRLVAAMNEYTDIRTDILGRIRLNDAELFKAPWLLFEHREHFKLDDAALGNLGKYLMSGGFVFADGCDIPVWRAGLTALLNCLLDALKTQGIDTALERLSSSHPVYHCYFDFDGPPVSGDAAGHRQQPAAWRVVRDYLDGIEVDGRLLAIYSQKRYIGAWAFFGRAPYDQWDARRPLQFGVNTIIYALTQEGSITKRVMDSMR